MVRTLSEGPFKLRAEEKALVAEMVTEHIFKEIMMRKK